MLACYYHYIQLQSIDSLHASMNVLISRSFAYTSLPFPLKTTKNINAYIIIQKHISMY